MLTRWLERISAGVREAAGESVLLGRFFTGEHESADGLPAGKWRFRTMRLQEGSRVRGMLRRCWERMLCASVGSLCATVFFAATACLAVAVLRMGRIPDGAAVLAPAVVLLSMLPGLGERRSLSHCLREGRLTAPFLFGFCGLLPDGFGEGGAGRVHRFLPLLCGVPVGVAGAFLPPLVLPGMACGAAVWFLLRAVPELSVLLLALFFPFLPLLPHPTVLLAAGTVLSLAVFAGKWISGRRTLRFGRIDRAALAFGVVCLLAGGVSGAVSALLIAGGWMSVRSLGERWRKRAAGCLILSASLSACIGILEYGTGRAALRWVDVSRFSDIGGRVCATFSNPNILAVFLLLTYPLALCGAGLFGTRSARATSGIGAGGIAICTVLTWSRGAWLGMLAETVLFLLLFSRRSLSLLLLLPFPAAACLPLLPHSMINRFESIGNTAESSVRYRLEVWRGVWRMLRSNPCGIGVREADFRHTWQRFAPPGTETVMHAHAILPQIGLETGIAGAAVFLLFLVCLARTFRPAGWSTGGFCAVCGALVMGMFDHLWYARGMLWLVFAVAALIPARGEEDHETAMEWD